MMMMANGAELSQGSGDIYVVQNGLLAVKYTPLLGQPQEYYLGIGGVFNLYTALTGQTWPA